MIDRTHDLPVVRQCQILRLARSTAYYTPEPTSPADLALMRRIDELHLEYPFAGSRMLRDMLRREEQTIGHKTRQDADEEDGYRGAVQEAQHQPAPGRSSRLSVPAEEFEDRPAQPGLGHGHHLHPDAPGLRLSGGHRRLA